MKTTRYGHNLAQLTRWPLLFPVNVFLVREEDGFTLIDTAVGGSARYILAAARSLGAPIVRIVLTHAHNDHIGSLDALRAALPDAELLMSAATERALRESRASKEKSTNRGSTAPIATRLLAAGERVGSLEVIAAPGHSRDQIALFDLRDQTLIAGDAFQTRAGIAVSGTIRPLFPFPAFATEDKSLALETARSLRSRMPSRLAVGHGNTLDDPLAAMDAAIGEAELKLAVKVRHAV